MVERKNLPTTSGQLPSLVYLTNLFFQQKSYQILGYICILKFLIK